MSAVPTIHPGAAAAAATLACLLLAAPAQAQTAPEAAGTAPSGELQLRWDARHTNPAGPLAAANRLAPGTARPTPSAATAEALLRHTWRTTVAGQPLALAGEALAWHQRDEGGAGAGGLRFNQLHLSAERGAWGFSAGKKVLGWDVGFGFRPNDVVQQETRRSLLARPLEGRPLLQADHFGADSATTLVWAQPQHLQRSAAASPGAEESALALRHYRHSGAVDWHGFARLGRHTGASLGAALAWVAADSVSVHASLRQLQRHASWAGLQDAPAGQAAWAGLPATPGSLARQNPWQRQLAGPATQALLGMQWTGASRHSLLLEAWHDGTAPRPAQWRAWGMHQAALLASPAPAAARAGNLAWLAMPFDQTSLHRNNLFARWSWQPDQPTGWQLALDMLWHPADGGRSTTASLQWQGDRLRIDAAWRRMGGPADALLAQLPQRRSAVLAATWSF